MFLNMQREDPKCCSMAGSDKSLFAFEQRKRTRVMKEQARKEKAMEDAKMTSTVSLTSTTTTDEESGSELLQETGSDDDFQMPSTSTKQTPKRRKKRSVKVITPEVAAAMDRVKVTDRGATFVTAAIAQSLGHNLDDIAVSHSTVRRARCINREISALKHKEQFSPDTPLLLHWDSKLLPDISGKKDTVDRVAILVTGGGEEKLLAVPKIARGTGKEQADACIKVLNDWKLTDKVHGLVFDTTASNTGLHKGACHIIEEALGRDMVWIACRHHILEIVLSSVFTASMGSTDGPKIGLFKRFQAHWQSVNQSEFVLPEEELFDGLNNLREEAKDFYKTAISHAQPREDYRELLQLALVFVGGPSFYVPSFRAPGALHNARWMAKAIYSLKMILFRNQFKLTSRQLKGLMSVSLFVAVIYAKFWHEASNAERAPRNDMMFLSQLQEYPNSIIKKAASEPMLRHLWYFSEHLVALALFDDRVSCETKMAMTANFKKKPAEKILKRLDGKSFNYAMPLEQYVSQRSLKIFDLLLMDGQEEAHNFLVKQPLLWPEDPVYVKFKEAVQRLKVVNDTAERGIALMTAYNGSLPHDEEQVQYLLQVVAAHRKAIPKPTKATLTI